MNNVIRILSMLVKAASIILGLTAYAQGLPEKYYAVAVFAFTIASAVKEIGIALCDYLDDGKRNNSYKLPVMTGLLACLLLLPSCGLDRSQWLAIAREAALREAPIIYGQVRQVRETNRARTAAKNPVDVTP